MKQMNSYKKAGLILLAAMAGGGILGALLGIGMFFFGSDIGTGTRKILTLFQESMLPLMSVLTVITVFYGEYSLRKIREYGQKILDAEEEECDILEYEHGKWGARGMLGNIFSQIFCILVLSAGYSMEYLERGKSSGYLTVCVIFLLCYVYDAFWQIRFVKGVQRVYPEKKGDPVSGKFQQQWLESCDEAEKDLIYRSAYRSYQVSRKFIPVLLVIAMLGHLCLNTGIFAILLVSVIWLIVMVTYLNSCIRLRREKLK